MKTPRDYQQFAIDELANHNGYLCDACGLGKTLTSIEAVKAFGSADRLNLVICRKTARLQWKAEILDQVPNAEIVLTNHIPYDFKSHNAWYITTYDELTPRSILYPVARVVWNAIIIDEAHKLKNPSIPRTKNITKLVAGRRIPISASPIDKHGGELWPLLKWVAPESFPSYWKWVNKMFEVKEGYWGGYDIGAPLDLVEYQAEVMPWVIRRTKQQAAPELPERVDIPVFIEMTDAQQEVYAQIKGAQDALVEIEDRKLLIINALSLFTRLHQVASLPSMIGSTATSAKMNWLADFLEDNPEQRVLVFSRYREVVEEVRSRFGNSYGVYCVMGGGVDESQHFKDGYGRVLAGTIDAMSESLSLEMADSAIFIDQHWSSIQMQQAVDRIHRMNITDRKFIYYLQSCKEDEKVMKVVNGKYDDQAMLLEFARGE